MIGAGCSVVGGGCSVAVQWLFGGWWWLFGGWQWLLGGNVNAFHLLTCINTKNRRIDQNTPSISHVSVCNNTL